MAGFPASAFACGILARRMTPGRRRFELAARFLNEAHAMPLVQTHRRALLLFGLCAAAVVGFLLVCPPFAQPLAYHDFADQRPMLGVAHFLNVASNLPFLIVGALGLAFMAEPRSRRPGVFVRAAERRPYWVFFVGLALT